MKHFKAFFIAFILIYGMRAQDVNEDMEKFQMGDNMALITSIAMSPDKQTIAAGLHQGFPIHIYDYEKREVIKKIDVKGYYAGPRVRYSANGKYLILQQQFYADWNTNKDKPANYMVVDIENGEMLYEKDNLQYAEITRDSKYFVTLADNEITYYTLVDKKKVKSFKFKKLSNAFTVSPDGSKIAVAHFPDKDDVANVPSIRSDKKAQKLALKEREMISIYDAESFEKLATINEIYDIVYEMKYDKDGKHLLMYCLPTRKMGQQAAGKQGYVNVIDGINNEAMRNAFLVTSMMEPDIKMSWDGKMLGVISTDGQMNPILNIYDFNTSKILYSFNRKERISTAIKEKEAGGFWSFVFLPDNKRVMVSSGNRLTIWKLR